MVSVHRAVDLVVDQQYRPDGDLGRGGQVGVEPEPIPQVGDLVGRVRLVTLEAGVVIAIGRGTVEQAVMDRKPAQRPECIGDRLDQVMAATRWHRADPGGTVLPRPTLQHAGQRGDQLGGECCRFSSVGSPDQAIDDGPPSAVAGASQGPTRCRLLVGVDPSPWFVQSGRPLLARVDHDVPAAESLVGGGDIVGVGDEIEWSAGAVVATATVGGVRIVECGA